MALPQHYVLALVTPFGRLNQIGFALFAIGLGLAHVWVYAQLKYDPDLPVWNQYAIALFAMLWMKFCILSRRMHDTGASGFVLVPVLLATAMLYLAVIDPETMGVADLTSGTAQYFISQGMRIPRALLIAVFIYCIRAQGEAGPNAYGPEFGEWEGGTRSRRDRSPTPLGNEPQHSYGVVARSSASGWSERRRPAGFGRR